MRAAAAKGRVERAARLRDTWQDLTRLNRRLRRPEEVGQRYSFVYPLPG